VTSLDGLSGGAAGDGGREGADAAAAETSGDGRDGGGGATDAGGGTDEADAPGTECGRTFTTPAVSSLQAAFDDALSDAWWSTDACVHVSGGELVAEPAPSQSQYCFIQTSGFYHLTCDALTVKVPEITSSVVGVQTVIYVAPRGATTAQQLRVLLEGGEFSVDLEEGASIPLPDPTYDPGRDVWWRLREANGETYFETSFNGTEWSVRGHAPDPVSLDDVQISIGAGAYQQVASPGRARFDCYNMPAPCP
jgi:hypothetical protein